MRPDEDMIGEQDRPGGSAGCGGTQHRVLTDDRALAHLDARRLGVEDRTVHHAGAWADAHVTDERGGGRDERGRVDDRLAAAMAEQH
jgi:hypothetical protein